MHTTPVSTATPDQQRTAETELTLLGELINLLLQLLVVLCPID